jgi:uncharacterized LabA/DUF88 family protein
VVAALVVLVDYDNVEPSLKSAGPVSFAKILIPQLSSASIARHSEITVRLYGGWRIRGNLTTNAQRLIPDIRASSPLFVSSTHAGVTAKLRLTVELADKPIGSSALLTETFVRDRDLRKFKVRSIPWHSCTNAASCGLNPFIGLTYNSQCGTGSCPVRMVDIFVRDEQKMVDTLIVADIAHQALSVKATDVVVVSSDTDMWPGILLALQAGCHITHIHPRTSWKTQAHLIATLGGQLGKLYQQMSL